MAIPCSTRRGSRPKTRHVRSPASPTPSGSFRTPYRRGRERGLRRGDGDEFLRGRPGSAGRNRSTYRSGEPGTRHRPSARSVADLHHHLPTSVEPERWANDDRHYLDHTGARDNGGPNDDHAAVHSRYAADSARRDDASRRAGHHQCADDSRLRAHQFPAPDTHGRTADVDLDDAAPRDDFDNPQRWQLRFDSRSWRRGLTWSSPRIRGSQTD
jgi:hypothetical protein